MNNFDETKEDSFFYILGFNPQKRVIICQNKEEERVRQLHHWLAEDRGRFNMAGFLPEARPFKVSWKFFEKFGVFF